MWIWAPTIKSILCCDDNMFFRKCKIDSILFRFRFFRKQLNFKNNFNKKLKYSWDLIRLFVSFEIFLEIDIFSNFRETFPFIDEHLDHWSFICSNISPSRVNKNCSSIFSISFITGRLTLVLVENDIIFNQHIDSKFQFSS